MGHDMGDKLVLCLIGIYTIILVVYLREGNWRKALYWLGAILINIALVKLK